MTLDTSYAIIRSGCGDSWPLSEREEEPQVEEERKPLDEELTALITKVAKIVAGEEAARIVDALNALGVAKEDEIAEKTGMRLNDVRKILYKLSERSLVTSRVRRDPQSGWFIYSWRLNPEQVEGYVEDQRRRVVEKLKARLDYEKDHEFYTCSTPGCTRLRFEDAMACLFRCSKCGKLLNHVDNIRIVEILSERIAEMEDR